MSFSFLRPALESGRSPQWTESRAVETGRARMERSRATGARIGRAPRLSEEQVRAWRAEHKARLSLRTSSQMAKDAGVSAALVRDILSGRAYKWVK